LVFVFVFVFSLSSLSSLSLSQTDDIFALVVLLTDGHLKLKGRPETEQEKKAERFFRMTRELPLELIMILVNRVYLSSGTFILSNQTEVALKRVLGYPFL